MEHDNKTTEDIRTLIVTHRQGKHHCDLAGNNALWATGDTISQAVGNWLITYGERYGWKVNVTDEAIR